MLLLFKNYSQYHPFCCCFNLVGLSHILGPNVNPIAIIMVLISNLLGEAGPSNPVLASDDCIDKQVHNHLRDFVCSLQQKLIYPHI